MPPSSFPVGKTVGAISCTTMTLFTKCYPPPLGTRINNTVPALKTTTVNRPVPALKKTPVPARTKNTTARSRRWKNTSTPSRPASKTKHNRPVPPLKKKKNVPSRFGKKKRPPRPASEKNNNRPVPPRKKQTTVPSCQEFCLEKYRPVPSRQEFPPLYFVNPALPPK